MTQRTRRRTLRDVADVAKVSEMTVSRVLRGKGVVSKRTREHVLRVVEELGYVQNKLAGSLATSRSNQVAVIIPSLANSVFTDVMSGVNDVLERAGYSAIIGISDYQLGKEEDLVHSMMSWRPAGMIVPNRVHTEKTTNILANAGIPVVEMMNVTSNPIDISVGFDHAKAGWMLANHLLSKGYRRFGYVGQNDGDHSAAVRFTAMKELLAKSGFPLLAPKLTDQLPNLAAGKTWLKELLDIQSDLDAVFFSNDTIATGGMIHCIENGISVPEQLALVGFSGLEIGQTMPWKLTTILTKRYEVGRISARSILNRLVGQESGRVVELDLELIKGETS